MPVKTMIAQNQRELSRQAPAGLDAGGRLDPAVYAAAGLSLAPALVYLWAVPGYSVLWWGYGVFFLATAFAQGLYSVALLRRPAQPLILAGIWMNLALIFVYIAWHADGIPLGPHTGMLIDVGRLDVAATVAQLGLIVALLRLLGAASRRRMLDALLLAGAAIWVLRLMGFLF